MDGNYFSNLSFPCPREAPNEIWATLVQRLQRRLFEILNIFPYKSIGKETWPHREKVKCQCMTTILAAVVYLLSLIIYAKIQPQVFLDFAEEDF